MNILLKKMNSITFDINDARNLSILEKDAINSQVGELLTKAQEYASLHSCEQFDLTVDLIANLNKLYQTYQDEKICLFTGAGVSFTESKYYETPG